MLNRNKLYFLLHSPWKCNFRGEIFGSTFCFFISWGLSGGQCGPICSLAVSAPLNISYPQKADYRQSTADQQLGNLNTFWICFIPLCILSDVMMGMITDWSLVCMTFWIQLSPHHIDLSVRFTSQYIKNAHFVFIPLRKGTQGTKEMPVSPLFSFFYISEIQVHEKWQIWALSSSFLGCTFFFPREWPAPTIYQVLLGRILLHPSYWCYMQLLHQILPVLTHPTERYLRNSREMRYLSFRAQYSEYFVPCLIQQLPSDVSDIYCKSWARDRRE